MTPLDRISVEPSRRCSKGCSFCYNGSNVDEGGAWSAADLVTFARSCAAGGVRAISLGGGEPLEWAPVFDVLSALDGTMFRSLTTNGLPLADPRVLDRLVAARPDKVHVSLHSPENPREVERVVEQVAALATRGVKSGVNLLVRRSRLGEARRAAAALHEAAIGNERIVFLPMRGEDTPAPNEIASVAGGAFQSMTCLRSCGKSPRFASIDAERRAAWCSYTRSRRTLASPTHAALLEALDGLDLAPCDGPGLVRLALARPALA